MLKATTNHSREQLRQPVMVALIVTLILIHGPSIRCRYRYTPRRSQKLARQRNTYVDRISASLQHVASPGQYFIVQSAARLNGILFEL